STETVAGLAKFRTFSNLSIQRERQSVVPELPSAVTQFKIAFAMRLVKFVNHRAGDDALKHELCDGFSMVHFGAQAGENLAFYSPSWITGDSARQHTPYRCQSRNHGLC